MKSAQKHALFTILFAIILLLSQPVMANEPVQTDGTAYTVSGKTFVYRNGIWIDTTYDPVKHPLYRIGTHSEQYAALQASVSARTLKSYHRLGDRLLIVHDGWGIEIEDSAESGPIVSTEMGQPQFLADYRPISENPPRVVASGNGNQPPSLIATSSATSGININIHLSWGEILAIVFLGGLVGLGIWLGVKEPVEQSE